MVHGFISVEIEKIRMILCHITTQKHGNRNSELRTILRNILPILDNDTPMLLMGDLNGEYADDVPTTFRAIGLIDSLHKEKQKIDYIYHSEAVGNVKVELKKEKAIRKLSDHFPLVALIHNEEDSS